MHIFFSGIGGTAIGPLSQIAKQAGYKVSGSDKQESAYITHLRQQGIKDITIGQERDAIAEVHAKTPIDWFVYSSAVAIEQPNSPELQFCAEHGIQTSKRDAFIKTFITDKNLKMIAVAGTHGKTTTTAMLIWAFKQLKIPISYSVGAKISFGDMGSYDAASDYFVYEADEFDRNFLTFHPAFSLITGIDWDHPDIYPTRTEYYEAFQQFLSQSEQAYLWQDDAEELDITSDAHLTIIDKQQATHSALIGQVNRENATLVTQALKVVLPTHQAQSLTQTLDAFPGVSRRFERISQNIYTDYAHTPAKIKGALQIAQEQAQQAVVVIYEGLHNTRQHFIKEELKTLFAGVKKVYIVPSYRAREDESLEDLTPERLAQITEGVTPSEPAQLNQSLRNTIEQHAQAGDLVLCLSAGGGGSLDEWLRTTLKTT